MKNPILRYLHNKVTTAMSKSWVVENLLIAKVREDDGQLYDCIYCTVARNAVLFFAIGVLVGLAL